MSIEAYDTFDLLAPTKCLLVTITLGPATEQTCVDCHMARARHCLYMEEPRSLFPCEVKYDLCERCTDRFKGYTHKKSQYLPEDVLTSRISHLRRCETYSANGMAQYPVLFGLCCACAWITLASNPLAWSPRATLLTSATDGKHSPKHSIRWGPHARK